MHLRTRNLCVHHSPRTIHGLKDRAFVAVEECLEPMPTKGTFCAMFSIGLIVLRENLKKIEANFKPSIKCVIIICKWAIFISNV